MKRFLGRLESRHLVPALLTVLGAFLFFFRLDAQSWHVDEVTYADAGWQYVHGDFSANPSHPPLAKTIIGASQLVGGRSLTAVRIPAAIAALLTGVILFLLVRRAVGFWAATLAYGLWIVVPHGPGILSYMQRLALLDVFVTLGVMGALYCGWRWGESGEWKWAALTTLTLGLALLSKGSAVLVAPVVLGAPLFFKKPDRRYLLQLGTVCGVGLVVVLLAYIPIGRDPIDGIFRTIRQQVGHLQRGHRVIVAGDVYMKPPWWTHFYYQWQTLGTMASIGAVAAVAWAIYGSAWRRLGLYLGVAMLLPLYVLSFFNSVKLTHYLYLWQPMLLGLVALTVTDLARRQSAMLTAGLLLTAPFAWLGINTIGDIATQGPTDYARAARLIEATGHDDGTIVVSGYTSVLNKYLPDADIRERVGADTSAVVVHSTFIRRYPNPNLTRFLRENGSRFVRHEVDGLVVYLRD